MSPFESFRSRRVFPSLDGIRGLSIAGVVVCHAHGPLSLGRFVSGGALGVDMFFVLSGFLISTLLLRERERTGTVSLPDFYARRALRIVPLYYGALLVGAALCATLLAQQPEARGYLSDLPFAAAYLTDWRWAVSWLKITWSLSAEEQFYLVWPAVEKYVRRPGAVLFGLLGLGEAIRFGLLDRVASSWLGWGPQEPGILRFCTFTPILLGVLLAHLLHERRRFEQVWILVGHRLAALVWGAALILLIWLSPEAIPAGFRVSIQLTMALLVASAVARPDHALAAIFDLALLRRIGAVSYGIYLLHLLVMVWVRQFLAAHHRPAAWLLPETLLLSYVLAEMSYRFYESPFLRLKSRFSPQARPAAGAAAVGV